MKFLISVFIFSLFCTNAWTDEKNISKKTIAPEKVAPKLLLKNGDVVAICGDEITSIGLYPYYIEIYQLVCCPTPKVTFKNFGQYKEPTAQFPKVMDRKIIPSKPTVATICYGMYDSLSLKLMSTEQADAWGSGDIRPIIKKFKENGVRMIVLGSPGVVDPKRFMLPDRQFVDSKGADITNKNLRLLRDKAERIAMEEGVEFADIHNSMMEVILKVKEKNNKNYSFPGDGSYGMDGIMPGNAGHLVMAWTFLKEFGYSGDIGTITIDFVKNSAQTTAGQKIVSYKSGVVKVESLRYPFCFSGTDTSNFIHEFISFNEDLNRYMLVVKDAPISTKITWGDHSKVYDSATLAKGINLAAEFRLNPFFHPFNKLLDSIKRRDEAYDSLENVHKNGEPDVWKPKFEAMLKDSLAKSVPKPVIHEIKIEPAN